MPFPGHTRPPIFILFFFSIFGFIGVTVLVFLWGSNEGPGGAPLFFKVFASFIAMGFIAMGFGLPLAALKKSKSLKHQAQKQKPGESSVSSGYDCPNCGANILDAETSPSGDVKCPFCKSWWNIHHR